jgi:hypothetical protein
MSELPVGPFETEQDATRHPAVQEIYESANLADAQHRLLEEACTAAGVELGHYDHRVILWLANYEPQMCAVVAALITRAYQAGKAADVMPVYTDDGRVNGISAALVRHADFIAARVAEDKGAADTLQFACRIPEKIPDFFSAGGPAAEAYWQHFTPHRAADQADATRRLVQGLMATRHGLDCKGYVWSIELDAEVWVGRPCNCAAYRQVEAQLRTIAYAWATHPDYKALTDLEHGPEEQLDSPLDSH